MYAELMARMYGFLVGGAVKDGSSDGEPGYGFEDAFHELSEQMENIKGAPQYTHSSIDFYMVDAGSELANGQDVIMRHVEEIEVEFASRLISVVELEEKIHLIRGIETDKVAVPKQFYGLFAERVGFIVLVLKSS